MKGTAPKGYIRLLGGLLLASAIVLLSGCGLFGSGGGTAPPPQPVPPSLKAGEAEAQKVRPAVEQLAARSPNPSTEEFRQALASFAASAQDVEVTRSTTPTNLKADSIQAAVKVNGMCVISGIRDGEVSTVALPVLKTGLCFVGDQR